MKINILKENKRENTSDIEKFMIEPKNNNHKPACGVTKWNFKKWSNV